MPKKTGFSPGLLMAVFLAYSVSGAQGFPPPPATAPVKHKPILMHWESLNGIRYYQDGVEAKGNDNLKNIISQLHDDEADRLLRSSKEDSGVGAVFLVGGLALMTGGFIIVGADPNIRTDSNTVDSQETAGSLMILVGFAGDLIGAFKLSDSKAEEFNAVQRYNELVYKDNTTSWNLRRTGVRADLLTLRF